MKSNKQIENELAIQELCQKLEPLNEAEVRKVLQAVLHSIRDRLTPDQLTVERRDRRGRLQSWSFQPYWLRVEIEEHHDSSNVLALASHGRRLAIAGFLSPPERVDFAHALKSALASMKGAPVVS